MKLHLLFASVILLASTAYAGDRAHVGGKQSEQARGVADGGQTSGVFGGGCNYCRH